VVHGEKPVQESETGSNSRPLRTCQEARRASDNARPKARANVRGDRRRGRRTVGVEVWLMSDEA